MKTYLVDLKKEISEILINQLIDHPEFNKEKFLETNPQLKEVVEKLDLKRKAVRLERKKYKNENRN